MKYKNAVVGQRVVIKDNINMVDARYFKVGQVGTITRTDDDESSTKFCYITLDGEDVETERPMYPSQLRKVKGDASE